MSMMQGTGTVRPGSPVRVVIVDDHAIFRSGLKADLDAGIQEWGRRRRWSRRSP